MCWGVLQEIRLGDNKASQQAQGAVQAALTRRWLDGAFLAQHRSEATSLDCSELGWGDEEVTQFAKLLSEGALPSCKLLNFVDNKIGDAGFKALAAALNAGALPNCKVRAHIRTRPERLCTRPPH